MKTITIKKSTFLIIAIFMLAGMNLNAQRGYGQRGQNRGMNLNAQRGYYGQNELNTEWRCS